MAEQRPEPQKSYPGDFVSVSPDEKPPLPPRDEGPDICCLCGGVWDGPYQCAAEPKHKYCNKCIDDINNGKHGDIGLNCVLCPGALVT